MRRAVIVIAVLMVASLASPQSQDEASEKFITHGEFAVLLLKVMSFQEGVSGPVEALDKVKRLELVPLDWALDELLTHGEFATVLLAMGVSYVPDDADERATRDFVEAMLRRERWKLRDYLFALGGGPGPIVSPSEF